MKTLAKIALATAALIFAPPAFRFVSVASQNSGAQVQSAQPDHTPLTSAQITDLIARVVQNQHHNDAVLDSFERIERQVSRQGSASGPITDEKIYRVVPTGSGTLKLLLRENGQAVSGAFYRRQLRDWQKILEVAVHPDDPRQVAVLAKRQRRLKDRARLIDAAQRAFTVSWAGREIRDGTVLDRFDFEPNPDFPRQGNATDWLAHARATVLIDARDAQVVSIHATIIRDISVGGGLLGKIYRGGHFLMRQAPVAPGIWEPTLYEYDISGRKFLFSFSMHQVLSNTNFQLLGTPSQLLAEARENLEHCCELPTTGN